MTSYRPLGAVLDALHNQGKKVVARPGGYMAQCPAHDDRNPSLSVREGSDGNVLLKCFAECAYADIMGGLGLPLSAGFAANKQEGYGSHTLGEKTGNGGRRPSPLRPAPPPRAERQPVPLSPERLKQLRAFQAALPGGPGAVYLAERGIPLILAQRLGLGYAAPASWPGRAPQFDRLVIPHTDPDGRVVNLYGRAIDTSGLVPTELRHDHLPGPKGYFNALALAAPGETLYICEGAFDTLALLAAGCERAVAIFGAQGWRWPWARELQHLTLALDNDDTGQNKTRELKREAWMRGKQVATLPPTAYGGEKDVAAAWARGRLMLDEDAVAAANARLGNQGATGLGTAATARLRRQRLSADPRPDLAADSARWSRLLPLAFDHAGDDPAGLFGALHGLRCMGAALVGDHERVRLAEGQMAAAEYADYRRDYLVQHEMALTRLIHAVADAEQVPAA